MIIVALDLNQAIINRIIGLSISKMQKYLHLIKSSRLLIKNGLYIALLKQVWGRCFGKILYIDLSLEVNSFISTTLTRMALVTRPIERKDYLLLSSILSDRTLTMHERHDAARRLTMLSTNIKTCYVVEDAEHNVRFLQWLILSNENKKLQRYFGNWYPILSTDEGIMEWVYVFPKYRGTGVLVFAVKKILDEAAALGVKRILAMIPSWNPNSLASFMKLGFKPYRLRIEKRCFGFRRRRIILFDSTTDEQALRMILPPSIIQLFLKSKSIP